MRGETPAKPQFRVGLLTPYLVMRLEALPSAERAVQIREHGASYDTLAGVASLETPYHNVILQNPFDAEQREQITRVPHLLIAGCSPPIEEHVRRLTSAFPQIVVARYSKFFGRPSEYSGFAPEQAGYALDIPKKVSIVKKFITHSGVVDNILNRNLEHLEAALEDLNNHIEMPVLATPYLREVFNATARHRD